MSIFIGLNAPKWWLYNAYC